MVDSLITAVSTLVGAIFGAWLGGKMAIKASLASVREAEKNIEALELRKHKVACLVNLVGLRFVIGSQVETSSEDRARLMFEINRINVLWSDHPKVLSALRNFYSDRTNEQLLVLTRNMAMTTNLSIDSLSDKDLQQLFLIQPSSNAERT